MTKVTDALSHATTFTYDAAGKLRALADKAGGQLLTDLPKPPEMTIEEFSISTLNRQAGSGGRVHFDLTNMSDIPGALAGTGAYGSAVTSVELRYIQANWARFSSVVTFYRNGVPVPPPW